MLSTMPHPLIITGYIGYDSIIFTRRKVVDYMRTLIFLIVISAFMIWFGINFRQVKYRLAMTSLVIGGLLALLVLVGVLRLV